MAGRGNAATRHYGRLCTMSPLQLAVASLCDGPCGLWAPGHGLPMLSALSAAPCCSRELTHNFQTRPGARKGRAGRSGAHQPRATAAYWTQRPQNPTRSREHLTYWWFSTSPAPLGTNK